jgi:hypothetical protein
MKFVPLIRDREMILYPAGFKGEQLTFEDANDAKQYREMYLLGLYVSPFGDNVAPHGLDDAGIAKLHPDDEINPYYSPSLRQKRKGKGRGRKK